MDIFNPLGQTWLSALTLKPEEEVISAWDGNREQQTHVMRTKTVERGAIFKHNEQVATGKSDTVKEANSGYLVLTSQRLVWLERHGFMSKQVRPTLSFDLTSRGLRREAHSRIGSASPTARKSKYSTSVAFPTKSFCKSSKDQSFKPLID